MSEEGNSKVGQEQIHDLLFGDKVSWQAIIYDLINTEQLDPWDLDLGLLANKFMEKVRELEEADFFVSSKVLLAAALLLRLKSEVLLNRDLPGLDEVLFGKKEEKKYEQERLELDEDVPGLVPRTPLPRYRKVSLQELMSALGKAIQTETRRIGKVVKNKQYEMETQIVLPKTRINLKDEIRQVYRRLKEVFSTKKAKLAFSELSGDSKEGRVATFVPLLHLDSQSRVVLEQDGHFDEIWIWLKKLHEEHYKEELEKMRKEVEEAMKGTEEIEEARESKRGRRERKKRAERVEEGGDFAHPLGEME
jgi:segregation and condensation protein A